MSETIVGVIIISIVLMWACIIYLATAVYKLKCNEEESEPDFIRNRYHYYKEIDDEDELSDGDIKLLKEFIKEYLKKPEWDMFTIHFPTVNLRNNKPVKSYRFNEFVNNDFNELKEMVLHPEKLKKAQDKIKLEKEIEDKKKELDEME